MGGSADVVVVGAGLIGCACAYSLAKRGLQVTVVEREDIASGASGACDGHVCCQSKAPGFASELARRSLALYRTLSDELGEETGFRRSGSWLVAESPCEMHSLEAIARQRQAEGLEVRICSGEEVREAEPILTKGLCGGTFCPTDGQTDPWRTALALARAARRSGAQFCFGDEVQSVVVRGSQVRGVRTSRGRLAAGVVLLTVGAWTSCLLTPLGVELPVVPRRGEILVTEPMPPVLSSIVLHARYVAAKLAENDEQQATLVMEQVSDGNLMIGSTRSDAGFDIRNTFAGITALAREAQRLAPSLSGVSVVRSFAGLRPVSPDGLPLIGPVQEVEGLFVATGHGGDGVALAPITGEIVGEGIVGGERFWPFELLPKRFDAKRA